MGLQRSHLGRGSSANRYAWAVHPSGTSKRAIGHHQSAATGVLEHIVNTLAQGSDNPSRGKQSSTPMPRCVPLALESQKRKIANTSRSGLSPGSLKGGKQGADTLPSDPAVTGICHRNMPSSKCEPNW